MSWLTEQTENETQSSVDKFLKIPEPEAVNKSTEVTIRILESVPEDIWRHWLDNRMFNCRGIETCPVCKVRNELYKIDKEAAQKQFRTDHRFFFNVLHEGKVKIFGFGPGLAQQLKVLDVKYEERYGDLRNYDVTVIKQKTGSKVWNVDYKALPEVPPRELTDEEKVAAETRYDLSFVVTPASREDLLLVVQGTLPAAKERIRDSSEESPKAGNQKATIADVLMLKALVEAKGFELSHFGLVDGKEIDKPTIDKLIDELKNSK